MKPAPAEAAALPTRPPCPNCDAPNDTGQAFCGECGYSFRAVFAMRQRWFTGSVLDRPNGVLWVVGVLVAILAVFVVVEGLW